MVPTIFTASCSWNGPNDSEKILYLSGISKKKFTNISLVDSLDPAYTAGTAFKLVGTNGATLPTNKVPLNLILNSNQNLPEFEISTPPKQTTPPQTALKKFNYWWLLLLIPIVYKISKKK